jgi:ribosomal protein S18 acetylase RimI-like enzyme
MSGNVSIRALSAADAERCDAIIASLPYFFGVPSGVRDCAEAVRTQRGFVAVRDGSVAGFLTLQQHEEGSAEITWMAVHADHRRRGIGRQLIDAAVGAAVADGLRMLFVLTAGATDEPDRPGDNYTGTRRFYRSNGFVPLKEFTPATWNQTALVLARAF